tara:strand:- start:4082 stop:5563 length:1482 start_codon:yes stop_codon:yes gene_type:complete
MGAIIEVKYFNSFLLKKINQTSPEMPAWGGSRGIPASIGGYPQIPNVSSAGSNWVIEEARIRGGYNNTNVDYGVKAYLVEDEPNAAIRSNSLIYSGIFNSRTGINNTNVFSVGEDITKSADPANGSIQKLYAEDTNLIIFQEQKVSRALIDKDAIYSAEGGGAVTNVNTTIGTIQPYAGNFGISQDPGSFAVYGYRKYFTDKDRNAVLRLSADGITEISNYGMYDFFRDQFSAIDSGNLKGQLIGGWDIHNKQYVLSTQTNAISASPSFKTLSFDETVLGWTSFFTYKPDQILSLKNNLYSLNQGQLWEHYWDKIPTVNRGNFYGQNAQTSITFVFNPKISLSKSFQTINYEGSNGWEITSFISDETGLDSFNGLYTSTTDTTNKVYSYQEGEYVINPADGSAVVREDFSGTFGTLNPPYNRIHAGFYRKENKYCANLVNSSLVTQGEVSFGRDITGIKGYFSTVTISTDLTTNLGGAKELFAVTSGFVESSY